MITIKTYNMKIDADIARTKLESMGIAAVVVGLDFGQGGYGGMNSIRLQVPEKDAEKALEILGDS
jgi:hypothetical protein